MNAETVINPKGDLCESHWSAGILPAWGEISPEKRRLEASAPVVVRPFAEVSNGVVARRRFDAGRRNPVGIQIRSAAFMPLQHLTARGHRSGVNAALRWCLGLLALIVFVLPATAAEWQWSVPMGRGRAFLWIPPDCKQLRAVVVAQNNMIELGILEHATFRKALAKEGIGEVFIAPPFEFIFRFDKDAGERFDDVMKRLAEVSGYSELNFAPVVPLGHSACASFPWNFAAWNPGRTLAVLSVHGDAPLSKYTGCGQPNPDWGNRTLDGVPGLMVMAEYEWGDSEHGVDRLSPALEYRRQHPKAPIAMLAEPGQGHFNYDDQLVDYLAMFVCKAARARLPDLRSSRGNEAQTKAKLEPPYVGCYELKPVDPAKGWLVERWHLNQPRQFKPAPVAKYKGDPTQAFWCFDKEMALATHNYMAGQLGKLPQLLSVSDGQMPMENSCGEPVTPRFIPDADGVTFHLKTSFMDSVPNNGNAARWAYLPAGSKLGHASGGGPVQLHKIVGPAVQVARQGGNMPPLSPPKRGEGRGEGIFDKTNFASSPQPSPPLGEEREKTGAVFNTHTFQFAMNRVNSTEDRRNFDIWVWASHPGDAKYKSMVQQAMIRVPQNTEGAEQHITFPAIPDQQAGTKSLKLNATSDAGTKVHYYVLEGPAEVDGDTLQFTKIPPRAKFPVKVTVVAWQHGLPGKVKTAVPVTREFHLTK
jgi:hypothetical protein